MNGTIDRRSFLGRLGLTASLASQLPSLLSGATSRKLKIGHTGITWREPPQAVHDIAALGYSGFETFGDVLETWDQKGGLRELLDANKLPLISAYCGVNLTDPAKRKDEVDKIVRWAKILKSYGGVTAVVGPNGVKRSSYDFNASKADIVASLNEIGKALTDVGVIGALHQHTGTCIEYRDEVYAVLDAMDTKHMFFGPDVGQLAKGGSDPVKVVKDFLPLIRHVHLKDWDGGSYWQQYCPLGKGKVDLPAILDMLETSKDMKIIMVELDSSRSDPMTPFDAASTSKEYLKTLGYSFRS
jgi:inosose dehydratase